MFWLVDRNGLLTTRSNNITENQGHFLRNPDEVSHIDSSKPASQQLYALIQDIKPSILIGCSAQPAVFDKNIVSKMHEYCARPIILPLSTPQKKLKLIPLTYIAGLMAL